MIARTPSPILAEIPETKVEEPKEEEATPQPKNSAEIATSPLKSEFNVDTPTKTDVTAKTDAKEAKQVEPESESEEEEEEEEEEEVIIHEVQQATAPQVITRARVVQVAKPIPPALPVRSPFRNRMSTSSDASTEPPTPGPIAEKSTPLSTPSLRHEDSVSSLSSVEGASFERITNKLSPKQSNDATEQTKSKDELDTVPLQSESPKAMHVPGGFQ